MKRLDYRMYDAVEELIRLYRTINDSVIDYFMDHYEDDFSYELMLFGITGFGIECTLCAAAQIIQPVNYCKKACIHHIIINAHCTEQVSYKGIEMAQDRGEFMRYLNQRIDILEYHLKKCKRHTNVKIPII